MAIDNRLNQGLIISLYIPWVISVIVQGSPAVSYWIAWLGSFFIFYQTWFSSSRFILPDFPLYKQIMRPIFLQQLVFAGFMCCTSVFYFVDNIGFVLFPDLKHLDSQLLQSSAALIAKCQRLSLLAHAALVTGILLVQQKHMQDRPLYIFSGKPPYSNRIMWISSTTLLLSIAMQRIPGLSQFSIGLYSVAVFSGAVIFVRGFREARIELLIFGGSIFVANVISSTLSGYKEHIIVNLIIISCLLFPYYKKTVIAISVPGFLLLFYILPTYVSVIRSQSWSGNATAEEARSEAVENILNQNEEQLNATSWGFLTNRLSEINMFTQYVSTTPEINPYYGNEILFNSLSAIIPRVLWPSKPITEDIAMERVIAAGVVDPLSDVSAKTRPVIDGYLSAGILGIFFYILFLGGISQLLNNLAENLFGGYETGSIIFFNGFFEFMWRGQTMEFMLNSLFWNSVSMFMIFKLLKLIGYIKRTSSKQAVIYNPKSISV